jgi:hypothetical protein
MACVGYGGDFISGHIACNAEIMRDLHRCILRVFYLTSGYRPIEKAAALGLEKWLRPCQIPAKFRRLTCWLRLLPRSSSTLTFCGLRHRLRWNSDFPKGL